jgi:CRISPR/Cas system-associated exonuclease Cas4 (RecB family)
MLSEHIKPAVKTWEHDRSKTVGASEIGACARQTWFRKQGVAEEREQPWGFMERGNHVEAWVYARLTAAKIRLKWKQKTLSQGHLSATLDGMRGEVVVDIKSFDPRKSEIVEHKHLMQVQAQIALTGATSGLLLYVNASDYSDMREVPVPRDPAAFTTLQARAEAIINGPMPAAEGRITGGNECTQCPFQTACLGAPIMDTGKQLSEADTAAVAGLVKTARFQKNVLIKAGEMELAKTKEAIRDILRAADVRRAPGLARVSRSARSTLDTEALEASGFDLSPYRKAGRETESVTIEQEH